MLKESIVISTWNRHSQCMWYSIKAIGYHDMFSILLPAERFPVWLAQVVFKLDRTSIEMYMDRGRQCNQVVRSKKVFGGDCISLMSKQQRAHLLKCCNGVPRRNDTEF